MARILFMYAHLRGALPIPASADAQYKQGADPVLVMEQSQGDDETLNIAAWKQDDIRFVHWADFGGMIRWHSSLLLAFAWQGFPA